MKFKNEESWNESVKANGESLTDYGGCVLWFAKRFASNVEARLEKGEKFADAIEPAEKEVLGDMGKYSLTGFQYGCAMSILADTWEHGEELRQLHNLRTQIGNEGEEANKKPGAVLNPALMSFR